MIDEILDRRTSLARLREAIDDYTVDNVQQLLHREGDIALARGDLAGVARALRSADSDAEDDRLATLVRLFLLGAPVDERAAARALAPLSLDAAASRSGRDLGRLGARRCSTSGRTPADTGSGEPEPWWVVSDFGADVRPGALAADHVLGVGTASVTLAQAVPRAPVGRALDLGVGSGVQALHLSSHAGRITGTDVSERALRLAATTAALSGRTWDLRRGSLLEPVAGERFDLVVANLPFVVSGGSGSGGDWSYRDSGLAGDEASRRTIEGLPDVLSPGGSAHLLANWMIGRDGDWAGRVGGWLAAGGCDAWVWQREVAEPAEYVGLWLRDAGLTPADPRWTARYDAWLDWFDREQIAAVGMGYVSLWRTGSARPSIVLEDVPQDYEHPIGAEVATWVVRQRWLADTDDAALLEHPLQLGDGVVREQSASPGDSGWQPLTDRLLQTRGMRWARRRRRRDRRAGRCLSPPDGAGRSRWRCSRQPWERRWTRSLPPPCRWCATWSLAGSCSRSAGRVERRRESGGPARAVGVGDGRRCTRSPTSVPVCSSWSGSRMPTARSRRRWIARKIHGLRILHGESQRRRRPDGAGVGGQPVHPLRRRPQGTSADVVGGGARRVRGAARRPRRRVAARGRRRCADRRVRRRHGGVVGQRRTDDDPAGDRRRTPGHSGRCRTPSRRPDLSRP